MTAYGPLLRAYVPLFCAYSVYAFFWWIYVCVLSDYASFYTQLVDMRYR